MAAAMDIYTIPIADIEGPGDRRPEVLAAMFIPFVFAVIAVVLRFLSRWISKTPFGLDDWLMIPALCLSAVTFGYSFAGVRNGIGTYIGIVTFGRLRNILLEIFVSEVLYSFVIAFIKFSFLALFLRIFPTRFVKICVTALGLVILSWLISNTVVVCLQCQPITGIWDKTVPASCAVNLKLFLVLTAVVNVVTDVLILALPIYLCLQLQQDRGNKIMLCLVFGTGFLVTIISIIRLVALSRLNIADPIAAMNITWSFCDVSIWSEVEQNIAIVSGCMPCIKPIISKICPSSLIPSAMRRSPTPRQSGSSNSRGAASSRRKNMWLGGGSWRSKRDARGLNTTDLFHTENGEADSQVALGTFSRNESESTTVAVGSQAFAERKLSSRISEHDLERAGSAESREKRSWSDEDRPAQTSWPSSHA